MGAFIDITDQHFGRLTVLRQAGRDRNNLLLWECRCECKKVIVTRGQDLRGGASQSCGCLKIEQLNDRSRKHGLSGTRPHRIWKNMKTRCYNPKVESYADYGARGIKICDRWINSFEAFWEDMHTGYADDLEIDRIDHDGDYRPENCRWASDTTQNRNKSNNRYIETIFGTYTVAELAEITKRPYDAVKAQANRGWTGNEILMGRKLSD